MVERGVRRSSKRSRMVIDRSLGTKRRIEVENRIKESACKRERKKRKGEWR